MYQKYNQIQNIGIALIGSVITLVALYLAGFSLLVCLIALVVILLGASIIILKITNDLKNISKYTTNVLPKTVTQAVNLEKLSLIMYDKKTNVISWQNEYTSSNFGELQGQNLKNILNGQVYKAYKNYLKEEKEAYIIEHEGKFFQTMFNEETIIFRDVSLRECALKKYDDNKDCLINIRIDNLDELSQSLDELTYLNIVQNIRSIITDYAKSVDSVLRRYKSDSYVMIIRKKDVNIAIKNAVEILEKVKEENKEHDEIVTISMGLAYDFEHLVDIQYEAGSALDMALSRGGDQIVVKQKDHSYEFYGGNSEATEKRNRVKVRMMANTLENLVNEASNVLIMPHRNADMDALGAAYGMAKFVRINNKKANIVADVNTLEINTQNAYDSLELKDENLLVKEKEALEMIDDETLLIIVDTSNVDLLESPAVYEKVKDRVVIDHHRRGEKFIDNALLIYIESYASSAVELVTELLRFQTKSYKLSSNVATLMLAGMMVDTSYFTVRTGVRTFDAAAILRNRGGNPLEAKELLQVNIETYQKRLAIVSDAQFYNNKIAISTYDKEPVSRALLAQSAVELLNVKDIVATFVIGILADGQIGISARSNGDYNVQHILETFGGGGHFSMAAAQLSNETIPNVKERLLEILENIHEGK